MAKDKGVRIHLPVDIICAKEMKDGVEIVSKTVEEGVPEGMGGFDIG